MDLLSSLPNTISTIDGKLEVYQSNENQAPSPTHLMPELMLLPEIIQFILRRLYVNGATPK